MSGAGKDTLANYFQNTHLYLKFRCAGTMKQIVSEKNNLSYSELEIKKRENEKLRKEHWKIGDWLGKDGDSIKQRIKNITNRDSVEFDILPKIVKNNPIVFCDVRRLFEAELLLQYGYFGIFLSRTTKEYKPGKHSTEINMFCNGDLEYLIKKYPNQCIIVFNDEQQSPVPPETLKEKYKQALNIIIIQGETTGELLIEIFKKNLVTIIPEFFKSSSSEILLK